HVANGASWSTPSQAPRKTPARRRCAKTTQSNSRSSFALQHLEWFGEAYAFPPRRRKTRPGGRGNQLSIIRIVRLESFDDTRIDLIRRQRGQQGQACGGSMLFFEVNNCVFNPAPAQADRLAVPGLDTVADQNAHSLRQNRAARLLDHHGKPGE